MAVVSGVGMESLSSHLSLVNRPGPCAFVGVFETKNQFPDLQPSFTNSQKMTL